MSSSPHDHLGAIALAQQRQRNSEQHDSLDVQETVFTHPGLLKDVLHLTGPGQHFYVSTVCTSWRAAYKQALQGLRNSRRLRVKTALTSHAAALSSLSRFQLAIEHGFTEQLHKPEVQMAAGQYADIETLHLRGSLGMYRGLVIQKTSSEAQCSPVVCRECSRLWAMTHSRCRLTSVAGQCQVDL